MQRPRAADDFTTIRARMEELRRERQQAEAGREIVAPRSHLVTRDPRRQDQAYRRRPSVVSLLPDRIEKLTPVARPAE